MGYLYTISKNQLKYFFNFDHSKIDKNIIKIYSGTLDINGYIFEHLL